MTGEPACFPAKPIARLLQRDKGLMALYKEAARAGRIRSVTRNGRNFVLVEDPQIGRMLQQLLDSQNGHGHSRSG